MQTMLVGGETAPQRTIDVRMSYHSARTPWALALLLCLLGVIGTPAHSAGVSDEEKKANQAVGWVAKYTPTATKVDSRAYTAMVNNCWNLFGALQPGHREMFSLLKKSEHVEAVDLDKGVFKYYPKVIDVGGMRVLRVEQHDSGDKGIDTLTVFLAHAGGRQTSDLQIDIAHDTAGLRREKDVYLEVLFLGEINGLEQGTVGIGACGVPVGESTVELTYENGKTETVKSIVMVAGGIFTDGARNEWVSNLAQQTASANRGSTIVGAALRGDIPRVKALLANGADPEQIVFGKTALCAAARRQDPALVQILLDAKARVDEHSWQDKSGRGFAVDYTPLVSAFRWGDWSGWDEKPSPQADPKFVPDEAGTVKVLLAAGAQFDQYGSVLHTFSDGHGRYVYPLYLAIERQDVAAVKLLLDAGAANYDPGTFDEARKVEWKVLDLVTAIKVEDKDPAVQKIKSERRDAILALLRQHGKAAGAKDGAEIVLIPAGEFIMGSTEEEINGFRKRWGRPDRGHDDEKPQRTVFLDAFYIYKNEVTVAQYRKFCQATGRAMPALPDWSEDNHPMINVTWDDADAYAKWAGATLPTEAQWEKAARGTDKRKYPWGNGWPGISCCQADTNDQGTAPVGKFPTGASPFGVLDMAGNVSQWCADWYSAEYYAHAPSKNPTGPETGEKRVRRGGRDGNYNGGVFEDCRISNRNSGNPTDKSQGIGFRCVLPVPAP